MVLCSPIAIANNNLKYFEEREEGYFLPAEHEEEFLDFINSLNNQIVDLQKALEKEREKSDKVIESKNERITNLKEKITNLHEIHGELQSIVDNKDKELDLKDDKIQLLEDKLEKRKEIEKVNERIISEYENKEDNYEKLINVTEEKARKDTINWFVYGVATGAIFTLFAK